MIESWKQSALVAIVVITAIVLGGEFQVWSLGHGPTTPQVEPSATTTTVATAVTSPSAASQQTAPLPGAASAPAALRADVSIPLPQDASGNPAELLAGSADDSSVVLGFGDGHSSPAAFQETLKLFNLNSRATTTLFTLPRSFTTASVAINARFMDWSEAQIQMKPGATLMLWDRTSGMQPMELARDPNAGGPGALLFVVDGSQAVYRLSAAGAQQSESLVWADLTSGRTWPIYTAPPHATVVPRALGDNYLVWLEETTGVGSDGVARITSERLLYAQLTDGAPGQPRQMVIPGTAHYGAAVLDGDTLYFHRDDGVVRIDNWRADPQVHLLWQRGPDAGNFLVGSGGMLAWTDSTEGKVVVFDTAAGSTFIAPSSGTGALVSVKGMLVWETNPHLADPPRKTPRPSIGSTSPRLRSNPLNCPRTLIQV